MQQFFSSLRFSRVGFLVPGVSVDGYQPPTENLRSKQFPFIRNLSAAVDPHPWDNLLTIIAEVRTGTAFDAVTRCYQQFNLPTYEASNMP